MNKYLKWFRLIVWIGILVNLSVAIPAILAPQLKTLLHSELSNSG